MDFLIHHMLHSSAARYPDKDALIHETQRLSYSKVARAVSGLADSLINAGIERCDRVGIFVEPSVPQVLSIFGVSQASAAFVPINHLLFPEQVAHIINDCRMKAIITTQAKLKSLLPVLDQTPSLSFVVLIDEGDAPELSIPSYSFGTFCNMPAQPPKDQSISKDLAAILYTSGSTGKAKGVMLNHAQIMAGASIVSTYLGITDREKILAVLPFSFDAGLNQLMTAFQQGGTLVLTTFSFAREIVQVLVKEEITGLAGVPTLWTLLAQPQSSLQKTPLPHLRYITNTGGAMPQVVLATLRKQLPTTKVFLMYGFTEAFRATYLPPEELDRRPTSMGKAIPDTEIMVVNEHGLPCKPGEVGELVQRGPTVAMGYWEKAELTERMFRPNPSLPPAHKDSERVCYSGDLVKADEEGFLYFVGRRDTMIKSSGYRISPTEIEEVLFQTGQIRGAAVIGVADEVLGQQIKAFVVPKDREALTMEALLAFCLERMPRYMVPKTIEYLDELPKTPTGKVDYQTLQRREDRLIPQHGNQHNGVAK